MSDKDMYIVVCLKGKDYVLASRTVFDTREEADDYALTVASSRKPIVVKGRWASLKFSEFETLISNFFSGDTLDRDIFGDFGLYGDDWKRAQTGKNK